MIRILTVMMAASTLLSTWSATIPAHAAGVAPAAASCAFTAHVWDEDPSGTNVRSAPSASASILTKLPQEVGEGDWAFSPEFDVIGFDKGWFLIENVTVDQYGPNPSRVIFPGPGWISSKLVSFSINDHHMRDAPSADAKVVAELIGESWGPESVIVTKVNDCQGEFAKVLAETPDGQILEGWVTGLCGNQVTTCS